MSGVHPLAWRAILDGRPWVCTREEQARLEMVQYVLDVTTR